ncbi:MAG: FAD-dependent thymidylate synthase [Deltaproteobacteria bacterium]|nr:FAD-dependent thymidylate synthase [Deltaproteobacteria bacterium]
MPQSHLKVVLLRHTPEPEEAVALAAKLCYSSADISGLQEKIEAKDQKGFVEKLVKIGHMSPIEHVSFTFGIEGISRACSHQLVRHRVASYSQQSQRYVKAGGENGFNFIVPPSVIEAGKEGWFIEKMEHIQMWYDELVEALGDKGEKSNEDARFLLPNAAETKIMVTMNARELLHFFRQRCCNRAQWEIRRMAEEMLRLAREAAPTIFRTAGPGCISGPCTEGDMTCGKIKEVRKRYGVKK